MKLSDIATPLLQSNLASEFAALNQDRPMSREGIQRVIEGAVIEAAKAFDVVLEDVPAADPAAAADPEEDPAGEPAPAVPLVPAKPTT